MKLKIIFNYVLLFLIYTGYSQSISMGVRTDLDGQNFDYYYSPFTYVSKSSLNINYNEKYEEGYYKESNGGVVKGFIKLDNDKIYYKTKPTDFQKKIRAREIEYVKIGIDSFFTATNFYYKNKLQKKPEFLQYITQIEGNTFARHFRIKSSIVEKHILVKTKNEPWLNFYDEDDFKNKATKYFGHIPQLKLKIESEKYTVKNLLSMLKTAEYYEKHKNNKIIYFDTYWEELNTAKNANYSAKISNIKDSILTLQYFHDQTKLYEINYSSFYPNIKDGLFTSFYKNGNIQKTIYYKNNKPEDVKIFKQNSLLIEHRKYLDQGKDSVRIKSLPRDRQSQEKKYTYTDKPSKINFIFFPDKNGNNIVKPNGSFTHNFKDSLTGYNYSNKYKEHKLVESYRLKGKDTIYQVVEEEKFITFSLQEKLNYYKSDHNFSNALKVNAEGTAFISVIINPKGYVIKATVLNKIHPQIDDFITNFIRVKFEEGVAFRYRFKTNVKRPKRLYETIIPISFSNNRFYRAPVSYNHFYFHDFMFQQQMWQQQNINNSIKSIPSRGRIGF